MSRPGPQSILSLAVSIAVFRSLPGPPLIVSCPRPPTIVSLRAGIVARCQPFSGGNPCLVREVAETLRRKQDSIANFGNGRHSERVRRKLLQLARDYGRVTSDGIRLDLPLTHSLLAEMIGSERETVTRAVDQLDRGRLSQSQWPSLPPARPARRPRSISGAIDASFR